MHTNIFDPNYDELPCNNIETCSLTIADEDKMTGQKTCGVETLTTHVFLKKDDQNKKWVEASTQVLEGYSYSLCIKCIVHAKITVDVIFEIEQTQGCSSYLVPL